MQIEQWNWIMDYCKQRKQNPADSYFWQKAKHDFEDVYGVSPASLNKPLRNPDSIFEGDE